MNFTGMKDKAMGIKKIPKYVALPPYLFLWPFSFNVALGFVYSGQGHSDAL